LKLDIIVIHSGPIIMRYEAR